MSRSPNGNRLYRYTNSAALIDLLLNEHLTLLDPQTWDDKNDTAYMKKYKEVRGLKSFLALCLTEASETYHHWSIFSGRSDGVRIEFNKEKLLNHFLDVPNFSHSNVQYRKIPNSGTAQWKISDLPFIKRLPYQDEGEYRLTYEDKENEIKAKSFTISLNCIERITISPWMPKPLFNSLKKILKRIEGCSELKIHHSTLVYNKNWIGALSS
ncbi:MAG: DUF2971 domain-containing protein [Maricaulaceae bacterium]